MSGGWLVTGAGGMLGREMSEVLTARGTEHRALARDALDLTSAPDVAETLRGLRPRVVVNCAAWTDVDGAEAAEDSAARVNAHAPRVLARACAAVGARLLHVSTDYVFAGDRSGSARAPYAEDAHTDPQTAYGRTKLAGERGVLEELPGSGAVVRTAWLYGGHGRSFVRTMAERALASADGTVRVVDDQYGQPTWTRDVARHLLALGSTDAPADGVFHSTSAGHTTWYGLAREVFRLCGADPSRVLRTDSAALDRPAPRPVWSVLAHGRRTGPPGQPPARDWRLALAEALPAVVPEIRQHTGAGAPHRPAGENT